ncbi:MAG: hypothetical protein AAFY42_10385 [Pseudomonadota bacterium]
MNEIGWLPAKHSPFGTPIQPQEPAKGRKEGEDFAAFLSDGNAGDAQQTKPGDMTGIGSRAPATIPQSAATSEALGSQDALISGSENAPVFFAAIANGQARYDATNQVSDTAVAFNERPIVGPASFSHTPDEVFGAVKGVDTAQLAAARADFAGSIGTEDGHVVLKPDQPSIATRSVSPAPPSTAPVPGTATATVQGQRTVALEGASVPQAGSNSASAQPNMEATVKSDGRLSKSTPTLPLNMTAAQSPAFAQLLASPSEYRLIIRSQRLSEDMRELVLRAVRSGLAEYGLPNRPLEIFEQEGQR